MRNIPYNKKFLILVIVSVLILVTGIYLFNPSNGEDVQCDEEYQRAVENEIDLENISEECRPLPDDVEHQVLAQALGDT